MKINEIIKDLLQTFDRVAIPGLGTFEAKYQSAKLNESTNSLIPPSKTYIFNAKATSDDGILTNYLLGKEKLTADEAKKNIDDFVKQVQTKLKTGETVLFDEVGELHADSGGTPVLKPIAGSVLYETYGLNEVKLPNQVKNKTLNKVATPVKATQTQTKTSSKWVKRVLIALPFIILIVLAIIFFKQIRTFSDQMIAKYFKSDKVEVADLNDEADANGKEVKEIKDDLKNDRKVADTAKTANTEKKNETKNDKIDLSNTNIVHVTPVDLGNKYKKFYLIIGSFRKKANADELADAVKKQGFDCIILPELNGTVRVSIGGFDTTDDAFKTYHKYYSLNPKSEVWLLKNDSK